MPSKKWEPNEAELNEWELYKRGLAKYHSAPDFLDYSQETITEPQVKKQDCLSWKINTLLRKTKTKTKRKPILKLLGWRTHLVDYIYFKHEVRFKYRSTAIIVIPMNSSSPDNSVALMKKTRKTQGSSWRVLVRFFDSLRRLLIRQAHINEYAYALCVLVGSS